MSLCLACGDVEANLPMAVCFKDRDQLRYHLEELVTWYDEMLFPPVRTKGRVGKGHSQPSPAQDKVLDVRREAVDTLLRWISLHEDHVGTAVKPMQMIRSGVGGIRLLAGYLNRAESWLLAAETAGDYWHEVAALASRARKTAAPGSRGGVVIGTHVSDDCPGGPVRAWSLEGTARCGECGRTEAVEWWRDLWPETGDDPMTDHEASAWLTVKYGHEVKPGTIRVWRTRGHVVALAEKRMGLVATRRGDLDAYAASRWLVPTSA